MHSQLLKLPAIIMFTIIPQDIYATDGFRPNLGHKMDKQTDKPTKDQFVGHLRDALNHLYDPERLRANPLAGLFGVAGRYDTPLALRRILTEAIDELEPAADEPSQSRAWRMYDSLLYRYVEQLSPDEVASLIGISPRQLRREQRTALATLANLLWGKFDLANRIPGDIDGPSAVDSTSVNHSVANRELAWLKDSTQQRPTDLGETLLAVVDIANKMAAQHGTHLDVAASNSLPRSAAHPVACRQILINLLSVAIPCAAGGEVRVTVEQHGWEIEVRVQSAEYLSGPKPILDHEMASLDMAHELAELCGAKLTLSVDAMGFDATLALPALEQLPVLVIDDNADTLRLLRRYAAGTRYRLITTQDPEQVLTLVEQVSPQIIVLDVMMPQVDGWEVLSRLQQHPLTAHLPTVVCTILAQKDLALLLGASAFVRKPVTQQTFLSALDEQVAQMARAPG